MKIFQWRCSRFKRSIALSFKFLPKCLFLEKTVKWPLCKSGCFHNSSKAFFSTAKKITKGRRQVERKRIGGFLSPNCFAALFNFWVELTVERLRLESPLLKIFEQKNFRWTSRAEKSATQTKIRSTYESVFALSLHFNPLYLRQHGKDTI